MNLQYDRIEQLCQSLNSARAMHHRSHHTEQNIRLRWKLCSDFVEAILDA
jgi:hypothetical protein